MLSLFLFMFLFIKLKWVGFIEIIKLMFVGKDLVWECGF